MAVITSSTPTTREPRLALSVTLERTIPGRPSVAEIASVIGVLTKIFDLASPRESASPLATLEVPRAHTGAVRALAILEHRQEPLIISAGDDGAVRSWRLNGQPGPLDIARAHTGAVNSLAILEHQQQPLIISAGDDGAVRSWRLNGQPGPLVAPGAHLGPVRALAILEHQQQPLIISAGGYANGAIHSWRPNGQPGPLVAPGAHTGAVNSLAILEHRQEPLIISSAGDDGAVRSWRLNRQYGVVAAQTGPWMSLGTQTAEQLEVRQLSFASPLEVHLIMSTALTAALVATPRAFGFVLYAIKRLWGFDLELRIHRAELQTVLTQARREHESLNAGGRRIAGALEAPKEVDALNEDLPDGWDMTTGEVSDADEDD
jgi:WD40 repeat protein